MRLKPHNSINHDQSYYLYPSTDSHPGRMIYSTIPSLGQVHSNDRLGSIGSTESIYLALFYSVNCFNCVNASSRPLLIWLGLGVITKVGSPMATLWVWAWFLPTFEVFLAFVSLLNDLVSVSFSVLLSWQSQFFQGWCYPTQQPIQLMSSFYSLVSFLSSCTISYSNPSYSR